MPNFPDSHQEEITDRIEDTGLALANNPMALLNLASVLALIPVAVTVVPIFLKYADEL